MSTCWEEKKYPRYYPEFFSDRQPLPDMHFACDSMAVNYFCAKFSRDLQAVMKDDGNGGVTCVQEFTPCPTEYD